MTTYRQRFRQWFDNSIDRWPDFLGWLMLGFGLTGFISEYTGWSFVYIPILSDLLLRVWPELFGIGLAVIIIDNANELLRRREEKKRLILQMGSPDNAFAREAVRQLRASGWLTDGSLQGANLRGADLSRAPLFGADLMGAYLTEASLREADLRNANLMFADLIGADLMRADISRADLMEAYPLKADLRGANLENADLIGADLREANLEGAINWTHAQLNNAKSLDGATMPDGTVYNPETFKENLEEPEPPE